MEVIQIGSIAILLKWVLLGLAILLGLLYMKFRLMYLQKHEIQNKEVFDLIFNSLFLGFLIWKGSMLILEPSLIIKSPFSLLYYRWHYGATFCNNRISSYLYLQSTENEYS
ncbi:hypothetical protein ACFRCQ_27625 [Cytobacillus firmus]|uniref:hypothetical protein n=1 Tax=Cytobacillus firmus TaxID=1399 RepID=UPI00368151B9